MGKIKLIFLIFVASVFSAATYMIPWTRGCGVSDWSGGMLLCGKVRGFPIPFSEHYLSGGVSILGFILNTLLWLLIIFILFTFYKAWFGRKKEE